MKKIYILAFFFAAFVLFGPGGSAQTLADYQFSTGHDQSRWFSLDSTRNLIVMTGSRYYRRSNLEDIGFSFPFANSTYSQFSVTHDGNLRLGPNLAISSSGNQGSPFFPSRAGTNNPKINFMGCAGYSSDSVFVHKQLFGSAPNRILVVEFALQTYVTSSRPSLLRWQVQLHENGDIQIVYPSQAPPLPPHCNRQQGLCVDETDIWIVDQYHVASHYTQGYSTYIPGANWPDTNRYYRFDYPVDVCPSPSNFVAAIVESSSITLAWDGNADSYLVEYATTPFVPGDTNASRLLVSDTTAYISGLQLATQYYFAVRSICAPGDTSNAAFVSAITLTTDPVTAPSWSCDFESVDDRSGWIIPPGNLTARWYLGTAVNNTTEGNYALYISQDSGATNSCGDNWVGTYAYRSINLAQGDWLFSFDWRARGDWHTAANGNTTYYHFLRAFLVPSSVTFTAQTPPSFPVPNASPHGVAIPAGWIDLNATTHSFVNQSTWTNYSTVVNISTPGCYNLVFYWETDGYDPPVDLPAAIDNIYIEHLPCPQPHSLTATVSDNDILLSWNRAAHENLWRVVSDNFDAVVQDTFCLVTGLDFNTLYNFEVFAICGEGDTSLPVSASFRTSAGEPVSSYPFFCDFEDSLAARHWVTLSDNQLNAWYLGSAVNNTPNGNHALYVSQDSGLTNSYSGSQPSISYAYRLLDLDSMSYTCSFDWKCLGDTDFHFMRAFIIPANSIPQAGTFPIANNIHVALPNHWIDLNPDNHFMSGSTNWSSHVQPFDINDSGLYALLFMWVNDEFSANNPPAAVDNVSIEPISCHIPTGLSAYISQYYIDITWQASGDDQAWLVQYGDTVLTTFAPAYNAENLTPNTEYTFMVSNLCSNGDTSLPAVLSLRTACLPLSSLPFICDFQSVPVGTGSSNDFIPCWNRILNYSSYSPRVANESTSGNNYLYWNLSAGLLDDATIVLPELDEQFDATYTELRFKAKKYDITGLFNDPVFVVGVMMDPDNIETFAPIDTIVVTSTDSFTSYAIPMLSYGGSGRYVAIRGIVSGSNFASAMCFMDDIELHELLYCHRPTSFSFSPGCDTIAVNWTTDGDESQWLLSYNDTTLVAFSTSFVARNLQPDREYLFSVAAICGIGDTSEALHGRVRTLPRPIDPPDTIPCDPVADLSLHQQDPYADHAYEAIISWSGSASAYEISIGHFDYNGYTQELVTTSDTFYFFDACGVSGFWSFMVRAICDNGLVSIWSDSVSFDTPDCVAIDNSQLSTFNSQLSIYPNPASDVVFISITNPPASFIIDIVDINGRTVLPPLSGAPEFQLSTASLASGIYFIRLSSDSSTIIRKLVIN